MTLDLARVPGLVTVRYRNIETGEVWLDEYKNIITDAGDLYMAQKMVASVPPALASAPNFINGVKLGTGVATPFKSSNNALGAYITGSNKGLDDVGTAGFGGGPYPKIDNTLGAGNGVRSVYVVSYPANTVNNGAISEAVLVTDAAINLTSAAGQTVSRALIGPYNKTSVVELDIVWQHLHLGA